MCALLIASYFLTFTSLGAFKTVLNIIATCCSVHLIRMTAKISNRSVVRVPSLVILIGMQIINLVLIALALTKSLPSVLHFFNSTLAGSVINAAFSLPLFFLYYFIFIYRGNRNSVKVRLTVIILSVLCGVYAVMHLMNRCIIPMLYRHGVQIPPSVERIMSHSGESALLVYIAAFVGFVLLQVLVSLKWKKKNISASAG